ncbi:hypothetical protein V1287_003190 [Bradyrhizobium sp. AZCC 1699]
MIVDQSRQSAATLEVDHAGVGTGVRHHVLFTADGKENAILDCYGTCRRLGAVESGEEAMVKDQIGTHAVGSF